MPEPIKTSGHSSSPGTGRRPYRVPTLKVFGTVAAITANISMTGQAKDGGPNNLKT
jgi:hypothetical protein